MNVNGSPDITLLKIKTTWDISGVNPVISLENLSSGPNLGGLIWWFKAYNPGEIPIHEGSENSPDITGNWTNFSISDAWAKAFGNILFSGAPFTMQVFVKDSNGTVIAGDIQEASICRPAGNTKNSTNTYGLATCLVEVKCADGRVFFQDTTNATYQGITGEIGASVLRVIYPVDETGNIPDPFVGANFSTALVPITYSSDNYQFQSYSIYDYDFGGDVHIRIRYQSFNPVNGSPAVRFPVLCNINLCALFCEVDKLVKSIIDGSCANAAEAQQKLNRINPLLWMISMGIVQPLCGIDVPALIEQVKLIGGFECDCCNAPTGIIPTSSSIIDGYNFSVVKECGDISGTVVKNGNNIQFLLGDVTYNFAMCDNSPADTSAFTFSKSVDGCVASVCLTVDVGQLAFDLLTVIKNDADLVNLFNSIVFAAGDGNFNLIVDGSCIFNSGGTYNYVFTLSDIPANTTFALFTGFDISGTTHSYSFAFNMTTLAALQAYLNTLGWGTFVVAAAGPTTVTITSTNNSTNINALFYRITSVGPVTTEIADMTKTGSGFTPLPANQVVQSIIDYLCALTDAQVVTSTAYTICYIDPADGVSKTEVIASGEELTTFITALLARGCETIEYIQTIGAQTCDQMKALFPESVENIQSNDYVFGVKNNECARVSPGELFLKMLQDGITNVVTIEAFCAMVNLCRGDAICTPYSVFNAELIDYDAECPSVIAVKAFTSDAGIDVTRVHFSNTPVANQTLTVEISTVADPGWSVVDGTVDTSTAGVFTLVVNPTVTPGQYYDIRVANNCASPLQYAYIYNVLAG